MNFRSSAILTLTDIVFLFCILSAVAVKSCFALYNADVDRGLYTLTEENFNVTVYQGTEPHSRQPRTANEFWIIQFYNSWCGHCIKFSPLYKTLGNKTQYWTSHLKLGAIDCASDLNRNLCIRFGIRQTPVLRLLLPFANNTNHGEGVELRHSTVDLLQTILDIMEYNRKPEELVTLPIQTVEEVWRGLPGSVNELAVIVEPIGSYVGKESIMHLLPNLHVLALRRAYGNNRALLESLGMGEQASTTFVIFLDRRNPARRGVTPLESLARNVDPVEALTEAILRADTELTTRLRLTRRPRLGPVYSDPSSRANHPEPRFMLTAPVPSGPVPKSVSLHDLDSAIIYSLSNEIGRYNEISGREYDALKVYIRAVIKWVPVKPVTLAALRNIDANLRRRNYITGSEVIRLVKESGLTLDTDAIEWDQCRGSVPDRRGYPCGLWQVFHTMSVRAYEESLKTSGSHEMNALGPEGVLTVVIGYVEYFFSCGECSRNFMRGAQSLRRNNIMVSYADAVLYLWRAHNNANRFLAGDFSEDPAYPKQQFPAYVQCLDCRKTEDPQALVIVWNEANVLRFLQRFYGLKTLDMPSFAIEGQQRRRRRCSHC